MASFHTIIFTLVAVTCLLAQCDYICILWQRAADNSSKMTSWKANKEVSALYKMFDQVTLLSALVVHIMLGCLLQHLLSRAILLLLVTLFIQ